MQIRKPFAFLRRDFNIAITYKLDYSLGILNSLSFIFILFFASKLIDSNNVNLAKYGGEYFSFVMIGVIFSNYYQTFLVTFASSISTAQQTGCLEAILSSQTKATTVILFSSIYSLIYASIIMLITIAVIIFLGFDYSNINYSSFLLVFFLSVILFLSAGILSAAGNIVNKKGNVSGFLFGGLSAFVGGAFFPISLFPHWMQVLAKFFPITYSFEALRLSLLKGYSISMLGHEILFLGIVSLSLFPISFRVLKWAINKGRREGTLIQY